MEAVLERTQTSKSIEDLICISVIQESENIDLVQKQQFNRAKGPYQVLARESSLMQGMFKFEESDDPLIQELWTLLVQPWIMEFLPKGKNLTYREFFKGSKEPKDNLQPFSYFVSADTPIYLDITKPLDACKYIMAVTSHYFLGDWQFGQVIHINNEKVSAEKKLKRRELRRNAEAHLHSQTDAPYRARLIRLFGIFTQNATQEQILSALEDIIDSDTQRYLDVVDNPYLSTQLDIAEFLEFQVVYRSQYKQITIGEGRNALTFNTESDFIDFLRNPANIDYYEGLKMEVAKLKSEGKRNKNDVAPPIVRQKPGPKPKATVPA